MSNRLIWRGTPSAFKTFRNGRKWSLCRWCKTGLVQIESGEWVHQHGGLFECER